jgi:hypothetical protein
MLDHVTLLNLPYIGEIILGRGGQKKKHTDADVSGRAAMHCTLTTPQYPSRPSTDDGRQRKSHVTACRRRGIAAGKNYAARCFFL